MKKLNQVDVRRSSKFALTVGILPLLSFWVVSPVRADLVYEDEFQAPPTAVTGEARVEGRTTLRQAIQSSERARDTVQSPQYQQAPATQYVVQAPVPAQSTVLVQQQPVQMVQPALQPIPVGAPAEIENVSKAELIRRDRVRTELKNEDILQERLEQLRIRDEQRRTNDLLTTTPGLAQQAQQPVVAAPQIVAVPVTQEVVGAPVTAAPAPAPAVVSANTYAADNSPALHSSMSMDAELPGEEERTRIQVQPRGGMSSMKVDSNYDVNARYTMGLGIGAEVSDNVGFELGYSYSEYGIALSTTNPLAQNPSNFGLQQRSGFENYALKQNVFDVGLKLYLLGQASKFRPFIGGGGAYSKGYVNYDQKLLNAQRSAGIQGVGSDYEISSFLGFVSTGFDLKLSKSLSIGGLFKYYNVLSSRESSRLNDEALYYGNQYPGYGNSGYYNPGYPAYAAQGPNAEKAALGGSLAQSGFYSVLIGATFTF